MFCGIAAYIVRHCADISGIAAYMDIAHVRNIFLMLEPSGKAHPVTM
jgi:hypothetical protein